MTKILLIDDEESIRKLVSYDLRQAGYEVVCAEDGQRGLEMGLHESFDLMVIDWMLPHYSGVELVRQFRERNIQSVMMMLTAKDEESELLEAFEAGVDDYVTKPFSPRELLARIQAHLKRQKPTSVMLHCGNVSLDTERREVKIKDEVLTLTKKEFDLLEYLMKNKRVTVSRDKILNLIWGFEYDGDTRIVDVHIFKLRNKLQTSNVQIDSIRGVGYRLECHE